MFMKSRHLLLLLDHSSQEIHIDQANKVVTTPAFMCDTKFHEIHDGVAKMVKGVLGLVEK